MKNSEQPAFPIAIRIPQSYDTKGLTKREYFAGQALAGLAHLYTNAEILAQLEKMKIGSESIGETIAVMAVEAADKILKQLES